jgi:hypothetical protein
MRPGRFLNGPRDRIVELDVVTMQKAALRDDVALALLSMDLHRGHLMLVGGSPTVESAAHIQEFHGARGDYRRRYNSARA